jgi:hypothetical protein
VWAYIEKVMEVRRQAADNQSGKYEHSTKR